MRKTFYILACVACLGTAPVQGAVESEQQFLFLDLQRALREQTPASQKAGLYFSLGEYYFQAENWAQAERFFRDADKKSSDGVLPLLTKMYLAMIARSARKDDHAPELYQLKELLSNKRFLSVFGESDIERWTSDLKNRYELRESVDHLEIYLNGLLFYTVSLP